MDNTYAMTCTHEWGQLELCVRTKDRFYKRPATAAASAGNKQIPLTSKKHAAYSGWPQSTRHLSIMEIGSFRLLYGLIYRVY